MHQLIRNQGDLQVSESSTKELGRVLEEFAENVAEQANASANEEGYLTVKKKHVRKVLNR